MNNDGRGILGLGDSGSLIWPELGVWVGCGGGRSVLKKVACDQDVVGSGS